MARRRQKIDDECRKVHARDRTDKRNDRRRDARRHGRHLIPAKEPRADKLAEGWNQSEGDHVPCKDLHDARLLRCDRSPLGRGGQYQFPGAFD